MSILHVLSLLFIHRIRTLEKSGRVFIQMALEKKEHIWPAALDVFPILNSPPNNLGLDTPSLSCTHHSIIAACGTTADMLTCKPNGKQQCLDDSGSMFVSVDNIRLKYDKGQKEKYEREDRKEHNDEKKEGRKDIASSV